MHRGQRSKGPRFKSHWSMANFPMMNWWSSYQLNQLGSKAASGSTLKQLTTCGVSNTVYFTYSFCSYLNSDLFCSLEGQGVFDSSSHGLMLRQQRGYWESGNHKTEEQRERLYWEWVDWTRGDEAGYKLKFGWESDKTEECWDASGEFDWFRC